MRIGIDARILHYVRGGIPNYVLHLLEALASIDVDTEYYVLHSRKDRQPPIPGPNFYPVACWTPPHNRFERWALGTEVARLRLDLLHTTDFIPPAFGYRRSVITVHDLTFLHYPDFITADSHAYYNRQIEWAVHHADHILADSHATKSDLVSMLEVSPSILPFAHCQRHTLGDRPRSTAWSLGTCSVWGHWSRARTCQVCYKHTVCCSTHR
jgi:hypothetical protein